MLMIINIGIQAHDPFYIIEKYFTKVVNGFMQSYNQSYCHSLEIKISQIK